MRMFIYTVLLIVLGSCTLPQKTPEDIKQRIARQVELLLDSGYLTSTPYIEVYEVVSNDSSVIYTIMQSDSPASSNAELPSKVIQLKGHFLCFIELDEPELSRTELWKQNVVKDSLFNENQFLVDSCYWLFACKKYGNQQTLVQIKFPQEIGLSDYHIPYDYEIAELWPFFSGGKPYGKSALIVLDSYYLIVNQQYANKLYDLEVDKFNEYTDTIYGDIFFKNLTDSAMTLSDRSIKKQFAILNGNDTLELKLTTDLPVTIPSGKYIYLKYIIDRPYAFTQKLPTSDTWMSMYRLFCDSTFCFLKINGVDQKYRLMHNDKGGVNFMRTNTPIQSRIFYNAGIDDKEERTARFFKWK